MCKVSRASSNAIWPIKHRTLVRDLIPDRGLVADTGVSVFQNIRSIRMTSSLLYYQSKRIGPGKDEGICEIVREST